MDDKRFEQIKYLNIKWKNIYEYILYRNKCASYIDYDIISFHDRVPDIKTGIDTPIYIDAYKLYRERKYPLMLYFQGKDMNYYPISVCKAPQLMVIGSEEYIDLLKLIDIYRYIQKNYKLLRQYADFDIDFWTYLDLQQPVTDNDYYTDYFETYDVDCFEHPCRFDNHDVINIKVTQDTENDKSYYSLMNRNLLGEYYLKTLYNEHKSVFEYEDYWTISSNLYFNFREEYKTYHDMSLMDDVACESEITLDFHGVESERLSKSKEMD